MKLGVAGFISVSRCVCNFLVAKGVEARGEKRGGKRAATF